ncbi:hypothetical protein GZH53_12435 [Flavihumibacter sp. R14]|nr:hypothetical protein [Flavihumibacter soli]
MTLPDIIATIGISMLLVAFALHSRGLMSSETKSYTMLNIIGAGLCGYSAYLIGFYPFVVLETIWAGVALIAFIKIVSRGTPRVV